MKKLYTKPAVLTHTLRFEANFLAGSPTPDPTVDPLTDQEIGEPETPSDKGSGDVTGGIGTATGNNGGSGWIGF